ncbi:glycosyltransferase family 39 protein, partial [bacterium]|nr:glycosyltransferase family 39 protein [bacterium]
MEKETLVLKSPTQTNLSLLWIFLLALVLRMVWILQYQQSPMFNYPLLDFTFFDQRAHEILSGQWFSKDYLFNPLYPLYLVLIYPIFGTDLFFPRLIQAVLGAFNVILVFHIARYSFNRSTAFFSAILTAIYLPLIYFDAILMATSLITFLLLSLTVCLISAQAQNKFLLYFLSGTLMGFVILGRPNFLLLLVALFVWIIASAPETGILKNIYKCFLFFVGVLLIISPITIHYWFADQEFIIVAPHGGINFYIGNNPEATGA